MLALVEPLMHRCLVDAPYLGCAMLIGVCHDEGIPTTLIRGQTRWLKNMFLDDSDELWDLIMDLAEDDYRQIKIKPFQEHVRQKGRESFRRELAELYERTVARASPRDYLNAHLIEQLGILTTTFLTVYRHYIKNRNHRKLRIIDRYVQEILACTPSFVGFSLHSHGNVLSRAIRESLKMTCDLPVIAGGPVTPFLSEYEMRSLFSDDGFDYVVVGEGERALPRLIASLSENRLPKRVGNLVYLQHGTLRYNDRAAVSDLESLPPPDFSQYDLDRYLTPARILPVLSSRGCAWGKCAFCSHHSIYQGSFRALRIERFVETLQSLRDRHDCYHFAIHDEDMPAARAAKIGQAVLERGLEDISFYTYARLTDDYNDGGLLSRLRRSGFCTLVWGLESGSQRVLDLMRKGTQVQVMGEILEKSAAAGISNLCFVMFGFPGETEDDAQETVRFLERHAEAIDGVSASVFDLEQNSPVGRNPAFWGMTIRENGSYTVKRGMSHQEALLFSRRLAKAVDAGIQRISSDKLLYVMPGHNRRMLRFLMASHGLLSRTEAIQFLEHGEGSGVYPLIAGAILDTENGTVLKPVNVGETLFTNRHRPPQHRMVDELEARMVRLADGTRSLRTISNAVASSGSEGLRQGHLSEKSRRFFMSLLSKGYAVVFARPWWSGTDGPAEGASRP